MSGLYLPWLVCLCTKLQQHLAAKNKLLVLSDSLVGVQAALSAAETLNWAVTWQQVLESPGGSFIHSFICCLSWGDWKTRILSWTTYLRSPYIVWLLPSQGDHKLV